MQPPPIQPHGTQTAPQTPQPGPRTSGLAITSMVLGIVSMTLCLAYFTAIPGLVFGIIALCMIKKTDPALSGKGMAIAGVTLSSLSIVIVAAILIFHDDDESSPWEDLFAVAEELPFEMEAPAYENLIGQDLSGSGFHFETNGQRYIGCSLHQFDNAQPRVMASLDFDETIQITSQVAAIDDVQVLTYQSDQLDAITPLPFDSDHEIQEGEPIYLLLDSGVVKAHVAHKDPLDMEWKFFADDGKTFEAMAQSGSPVVSGLTGKVIGVFLSADDAMEATNGGFGELRLR